MPASNDPRPLDVPVPSQAIIHPEKKVLDGKKVRLEPLSEKHIDDMWETCNGEDKNAIWDYMPAGPFETKHDFTSYVKSKIESKDPLFFAVIDKSTDKCMGHATLMRIDPSNRVIEVGNILFSPLLQRTTLTTETQYLFMKYVFDELNYRRYEWKCHNMNSPSKKAAQRLGFQFEGVFRKHLIYKGRNRDTAWFSIIDDEWPVVKKALELYLDGSNFDGDGNQKQGLKQIRDAL